MSRFEFSRALHFNSQRSGREAQDLRITDSHWASKDWTRSRAAYFP